MTIAELIPELAKLSRDEKLQVLQSVASDLAANDRDSGANQALPQDVDEATDRALQYYNVSLKSILEPLHAGKDVAIHVDTKSYEVANGVGPAYRAMRRKQSAGPIVVHRIGIADPRLEARMKGEKFS